MPPSPHDALFKAAFGQPDLARSELELVLPRAISSNLDFATLAVAPGSFVDDDLRHAHTDLLYTVRTIDDHEALVFVLFEHQSTFDALMPLRLLRYVVRVWDKWISEHPNARTLPIVLPVLLHHGPSGWNAPPDLAPLFDVSPSLLEAARPFLPLFRFVLDDVGALSLNELASRTLHALTHLVELAFWSARSLDRLEQAAPLMRELAATVTRDARTRALLEQLYIYVLRAAQPDVDAQTVRTILLDVAGPDGREDLMNAAEQLIEQGRAEGLARGREEAIAGLRTAIETTFRARGLALSEIARARIAACTDLETLTAWLAKAVTISSEADVFAP